MEYEWKGDLDDDCSLRVGDLLAHVECMGDFISIDDEESVLTAERMEYWHCSVSRVDERGMVVGDDLFNSADAGGLITTGSMGRCICEAVIRQAAERLQSTETTLLVPRVEYDDMERTNRELAAEVERLRTDNELMRQGIHFCSGSCRLPEDAAKISDILKSWGFRPVYEDP